MRSLSILIMSLSAMGLVACSAGKDPNVELIQDMMDQENVKPQEYDSFFSDNAGGARVPPEHTVPVGFTPYKFATNLEGAKNNRNPLAADKSPETLMVGQKFFVTHCSVCHGERLAGDGPVKAKYPLPIPALNSDKMRGWTDGQIYHVISQGQGLMGPYASHVPQKYRWQVVNYIRYLQQNGK